MELAGFWVAGSVFGWFGVAGLGLLGSVVELAHWRWRGKWKWNRGAPTVITQPVLDVTMHWLLGPTIFTYLRTCHWVMVFEFWKQVSTIFIFHDCHPFFESPSNENHDPKLVQTNHHLRDSHDLDDGNRKLSDITQSSSHLNNL